MTPAVVDAQRVVVTGIGLATPLGMTVEDHWARTVAGASGISRISRFDPSGYPVRLAGEVADFDPARQLSARLLPQTDHMTRLALVAATAALTDARIRADELPEFGMGVVTSCSAGGFDFGQRELEKLWVLGPQHVSAYQSFAWFYAVNTGQISILHGLRGPGGVLVSDEAGGLDALGHARRHVRRGIPGMLAGGLDSTLCPWGLTAQLPAGRLSRRDRPERAYLPFDADANGAVPGEGGSLIVLESAASAQARQVRVYGEIAGYAATLDPPPGSGRPSTLGRAAEAALADAGLEPADIDVVFADGAGMPELDRAEAAVITALVGPYRVPVTAPKAGTGRLAAGGSPVDVVSALLALRDQVVPPTPHVAEVPQEYQIDLVTGAARAGRLHTALVLARGGGFNSALIVRSDSPPSTGSPGGDKPEAWGARRPRPVTEEARS